MKTRALIVSVTIVVSATLLSLYGCKQEKPAAKPAAPAPSSADTSKPAAVETTTTAETEQTTCPVMGNPIDKNIYVEYEGKKVYFCCTSCKGEFEKDPEKYISKLPQFKQ